MKGIEAIFFDLDDTLLETKELLLDRALKNSSRAALDAGLQGYSEEGLYTLLKEWTGKSPGLQSIRSVCRQIGVPSDGEVFRSLMRGYFSAPLDGIGPDSRVIELLKGCAKGRSLFLVTSGIPGVQKRKVALLEMEGLFEKIIFVDLMKGEKKLSAFKLILEESGIPPSGCMVVGDRVKGEIRDGNLLGMVTVRVRRGEFEGVDPESPEEVPTFTIGNILELKDLLKGIEKGGRGPGMGGSDEEG